MDPSGNSRRATIGPYRLGDMLGGGGMGVVFRGEAPDGRAVAIKVLRAHLTRDADVARFLREASIRIEHRNVIEVLDSGVDRTDGTPYIAFELLEGESLETRLERGPLAPREATDLAIQIAEALEAVHAQAIVHRDLKPANVFCCANGTVKLLDFGIARVADTRLTSDGAVVGTLAYLSPEQARGGPDVDAGTDVWALGAVLFEMVTGRVLFERPSPVSILLAILNEPVPRIEQHGVISPSLSALIERCLRREPAERWADAASVGAALRGLGELAGAAASTGARVTGADATAETMATSPGEARIRHGEQRIVAVLLATGVIDMASVEHCVVREGGTFFPLLGRDGIGLFGALEWDGDETHRAVRAGLECRLAARAVAVGSGRVRASGVGIAGDALRQAEVASRAAVMGVAVDPVTARAIRDAFSLRAVGDDVLEVIGESPQGDRATAMEGAIVGRAVEMSQLRAMSSIAFGARRATLVMLTGPSGSGKSRLRRELARELASSAPTPQILTGAPASRKRSIAMSLWASVLAQRAHRGASEERWPSMATGARPIERAMAVQALAREAVPEAQVPGVATFLAQVLDVDVAPSAELDAARRDPSLMHDRVRRAVLDWIGGHVSRGPTALLLDDVQWADAASLALLREVLTEHRDQPLFVLAGGREEASPDAELDRLATLRLRLGGLDRGAVAALARHAAGRELPAALVDSLTKRTEGNPLFVEQLVLHLRDGALLDGEPKDLPLPLSVEAAVQARLDRLAEPERELVKLLSVIGRGASAMELSSLGAGDPAPRLEGLVAREILLVQQAGTDLASRRYGFRSGLTAEVAYQSIVPEVRSELHARFGRHLVEHAADAEEAASQLERGNATREAAAQYVSAAIAASRRGDSESVLRCSASALELGVDDADDRFELQMARADAHRFRGERDAQGAALERALDLTRRGAPHVRVLTERAVWLLRAGDLDAAETAAEAALGHARGIADAEAHALALGRLGEIRSRRGKTTEARDALDRAATMVALGSPRVRGMIAEWQGLLEASVGNVGEARAHFAAAASLLRAAGDERRAAGNLANLADSLNRVGAYDEASDALRDALEACRRVGNRLVEGFALANLGYSRMGAGAFEEGLALAEEAVALADLHIGPFLGGVARAYRARALLALGEVAAAEQAAAGAIDAFSTAGQTPWRAVALATAAQVSLAAGRIDEALDRSAAAIALRDELDGVEEDEMEIFLARADALQASGDEAGAQAIRARGRTRLEALAARITDPEWRERFLRGPAKHRALFGR